MVIDSPALEKSSVAGVAVALLAVLALAWLALRPAALPAPVPSAARAEVFSATRAQAHVQVLAQTPRPIASAANARARDFILERLRAAGLEPEVQVATAQHQTQDVRGNVHVTVGVVHNIVVRKRGIGLPGQDALLLATHYDSAPDSLGAADAGGAVAALLETLRALQSGPALENDLVVLFADGEEAGSLGATAFARDHPWAKKTGLALHFDGAGRSGPLVLLDARGGNGGALAAWARVAPAASGASHLRATGLARRLEEGGALRSLGAPSMSFANLEASAGHHGTLDTPSRYDPRTLQHSGDTMLALVREFGNRPLAAIKAPDQVYFSIPGLGVIHYAEAHVWYLTRAVCLVFVIVVTVVVVRGAMSVTDLFQGALGYLLMIGLAAIAAHLLWRYFPGMDPLYRPRTAGAGEHDHWYLAAAAALTSAIFIFLQRRLQAAIGMPAAVLGALLVMLALLLAASAFAPGASYLLAWPLAGALIAFGALYVPRVAALPWRARVAILVAGLAPAIVLLAPVVRELFALLTPEHMDLPMMTLALLLGMGTTLLAATHRRFVAPALLAASAGCMTVANAKAPYAGPVERANRMTYLADAHTWKAYWLLPDAALDAYSRPFFPGVEKRRELYGVDGIGGALWVGDAPRGGAALPQVDMLSNDARADVRKIAFALRSQNAAPTIELRLGAGLLRTARLDGKPLAGGSGGNWRLTLHGMGKRQLRFAMDLAPHEVGRVHVMEKIPGLPDTRGGARPAHTPLTATTLATDVLVFR